MKGKETGDAETAAGCERMSVGSGLSDDYRDLTDE